MRCRTLPPWFFVTAVIGLCVPVAWGDEAAPLSALAKMRVKEVTVFKDGHALMLHEGKMPVERIRRRADGLLAGAGSGHFLALFGRQRRQADRRSGRTAEGAGGANVAEPARIARRQRWRGGDRERNAAVRRRREARRAGVPGRHCRPAGPQFEGVGGDRSAGRGREARRRRATSFCSRRPKASAPSASIAFSRSPSAVRTRRPSPAKSSATCFGSSSIGAIASPPGKPTWACCICKKAFVGFPATSSSSTARAAWPLQLEATLINELADLEDVTANLVVGVPTFAFADTADPIGLGQCGGSALGILSAMPVRRNMPFPTRS